MTYCTRIVTVAAVLIALALCAPVQAQQEPTQAEIAELLAADEQGNATAQFYLW